MKNAQILIGKTTICYLNKCAWRHRHKVCHRNCNYTSHDNKDRWAMANLWVFYFWTLSHFIVDPRAVATAAIKAKLYASIGIECYKCETKAKQINKKNERTTTTKHKEKNEMK